MPGGFVPSAVQGEQAPSVRPVDPLQRRGFHVLHDALRPPAPDHLRLEEADSG
jgi:hypothetical protein